MLNTKRTPLPHKAGIQETTVSKTLSEDVQMQFLFQGNPVLKTHFKCHWHLTPTI